MSLRALLWDLDGTLSDTEHCGFQAETDVMALHGYVWTESDQRHCLGGPIERVTQYMSECAVDATPPRLLARSCSMPWNIFCVPMTTSGVRVRWH